MNRLQRQIDPLAGLSAPPLLFLTTEEARALTQSAGSTAVSKSGLGRGSNVGGPTLFVDGGWTAVDGPPTGLTQ